MEVGRQFLKCQLYLISLFSKDVNLRQVGGQNRAKNGQRRFECPLKHFLLIKCMQVYSVTYSHFLNQTSFCDRYCTQYGQTDIGCEIVMQMEACIKYSKGSSEHQLTTRRQTFTMRLTLLFQNVKNILWFSYDVINATSYLDI